MWMSGRKQKEEETQRLQGVTTIACPMWQEKNKHME